MENLKDRIELENIAVYYNDYKDGLKAVDDISMTIKQGEFVSIVGPSGCGKSTILKVISDTLNEITSNFTGKVNIMGQSQIQARKARKVGFVFQKPTLLQWRNVSANISLPLEIIGLSKTEITKRVLALLKLVKLEKYLHFHPDQLSGGMQQKVAIARALAYDPEILLMDEPFSALDEINRRKMDDELIKLWQKTRKTIIFVTHSIEEAVYLSERVIVFSKLPSKIKATIPIRFKYPRGNVVNDLAFYKHVTSIRSLLENEE